MQSAAKIIYYQEYKNKYGALVEWHWKNKTKIHGEKPVPVPLCPPQIICGLAYNWTWVSEVTGWLKTTWDMAWPNLLLYGNSSLKISYSNIL